MTSSVLICLPQSVLLSLSHFSDHPSIARKKNKNIDNLLFLRLASWRVRGYGTEGGWGEGCGVWCTCDTDSRVLNDFPCVELRRTRVALCGWSLSLNLLPWPFTPSPSSRVSSRIRRRLWECKGHIYSSAQINFFIFNKNISVLSEWFKKTLTRSDSSSLGRLWVKHQQATPRVRSGERVEAGPTRTFNTHSCKVYGKWCCFGSSAFKVLVGSTSSNFAGITDEQNTCFPFFV